MLSKLGRPRICFGACPWTGFLHPIPNRAGTLINRSSPQFGRVAMTSGDCLRLGDPVKAEVLISEASFSPLSTALLSMFASLLFSSSAVVNSYRIVWVPLEASIKRLPLQCGYTRHLKTLIRSSSMGETVLSGFILQEVGEHRYLGDRVARPGNALPRECSLIPHLDQLHACPSCAQLP